MKLKAYYQKLRQTEESLPEGPVVVSSLETQDGGRAGVLTEVPRDIAAKLIVDGAARLATAEEVSEYNAKAEAARRAAERAAMANRIQVTVVPEWTEEKSRPKQKIPAAQF